MSTFEHSRTPGNSPFLADWPFSVVDETGYVLLEVTVAVPRGVLANFTGRDEAVACLEYALMRGVKASLITREIDPRILRSQTSLRRR